MQIKILSKEQRKKVYFEHMTGDFHPSELKPYDRIEYLVDQGEYLCYGIFEEDVLLGYSYFGTMNQIGKPIQVLDFYAILDGARSRGIGSWFLQQLRSLFGSEYLALLAEVENPTYAEKEENRRLRERRIDFYTRNGFIVSEVCSRVLQDQYQIIYYPFRDTLSTEAIKEGMKDIYLALYQQEFYDKNIWVGVSSKEVLG